MTNKEIFNKVINKAEEKGYTGQPLDYAPLYKAVGKDEDFEIRWKCTIFSHEFAKAFWGEDIICGNDENEYLNSSDECTICKNYFTNWIKRYEYHLQQMVIEENPLKYLEKFL